MKKSNFLNKFVIFDQAGNIAHEFKLTHPKNLIGSAPQADIRLEDELVSFYHAIVFISKEGIRILDLESVNGIYINSKKISKEAFCTSGDIIQIGNSVLHCLEYEAVDVAEVFIEKVKKQQAIIGEPDLPLIPKEGLAVIDGEYCDIVFDDSRAIQCEIAPHMNQYNFSNYVDFSEDEHIVPKDFITTTVNHAIELSIITNGTVLSIEYLELKNSTYFASNQPTRNKTINVPNLQNHKSIPFITIEDGIPNLHYLDGYNCNEIKNKEDVAKLRDNQVYIYTNRTTQIFIRLTDAPPILSKGSFFGNNNTENLHSLKVASLLISLMLVLLLVDNISPIPEAKQIAIIYKKPVISEDSKFDDGGTKNEAQDNSKEQRAKESPAEVAKPQKAPEPVKPQTSPPVSEPPKKQPMKTYEFKMNNSFNALLDSKVDTSNLKVENQNVTNTNTQNVPNTKNNTDLRAGINTKTGTLGKDSDGEFGESFGSQGLLSKDGVDTTYVQPQTIVLGSIDPELLRRILQEYLPQFRHCYQQELEVNDSVKGVVDLNFQINAEGSAGKINIKTQKSAFTQRGLNCMGTVLKKIPFPKPKGGGVVDVRQPLNFFSEKGGK